ncbi:M42 family metallopeptidase [Halobacterium litoreum]|uniref:M42 family metallopeptidase n=1 Tax=Halobacterium litoreum TaxID=2039234 RepID=A0ABD5NHN7_9EURY|nr:M20/M25/M40 family metallo-hydrolase [Halobacterium litoreum]UHH12476.1 M20/M25/M40 family metallo-hydrolase [Halobacterium litoreum]
MAVDLELLGELSETSGAPGHEDRIRDIVRDSVEDEVDEIRTDAMGNLAATVEGSQNPEFEVLVAAHMDEIGFVVRHIHDDGFVQVDPLGGWDPRILRAERATVHTDEGDLPGVIGSPPPHTDDNPYMRDKDDVRDVFIDVGLPADEVEDVVNVGDRVTLSQSLEPVGDLVTGKAIDNRVSVYALLKAASRTVPRVTVHWVATTQEEVGLRGAEAVGFDIDPDLVLNLDTTVANDIPQFVYEEDYVTELGEGAAIKFKDGVVLPNPKVTDDLVDVAENQHIDYQREVLTAGGTDTGAFQRTHGATPVGAISTPTRYLHTPTEAAHAHDVDQVVDLTAAFVMSLDGTEGYTL